MYNFTNDYNETAHQDLLKAFSSTANQKLTGYGFDECCIKAKENIRK